MKNKKATDVFITFHKNDLEFATRLTVELKRAEKKIHIGSSFFDLEYDWWDKIKQAIDNATIFVFVVSPDSLHAMVTLLSLRHAVKNKKHIFPIHYKPVEDELYLKRFNTLTETDFRFELQNELYLENLIATLVDVIDTQNAVV